MSETEKYAVIKTGGQQFVVREGDKIKINKVSGEAGNQIVFDQVLAVTSNNNTELGEPVLSGRTVNGKILAQTKAAKVISFKKKRRKGFNWKKGHRQQLTEILVEAIN